MFIEITDSGFKIDDSHFGEDRIIEHPEPFIQKYGYDRKSLSTGVHPGPDFGYYELADRYWRASLCIYFVEPPISLGTGRRMCGAMAIQLDP